MNRADLGNCYSLHELQFGVFGLSVNKYGWGRQVLLYSDLRDLINVEKPSYFWHVYCSQTKQVLP